MDKKSISTCRGKKSNRRNMMDNKKVAKQLVRMAREVMGAKKEEKDKNKEILDKTKILDDLLKQIKTKLPELVKNRNFRNQWMQIVQLTIKPIIDKRGK